ncbi:xanthine dehydrogenase family protein subunit M [Aquimarina addita]|uniref:Xanthine dehydrogenase family protein subunit M n=1 Tax=Aquimarina addita TaxID=870485 RepID=A0ABP6UYV8_9FLAO
MNSFGYKKAASIEDTLEIKYQNKTSSFIAGGTNLLDLWKYNLQNPSELIDLNGLEDLKRISRQQNGTIRLGALATNAYTAYHPEIENYYPILSRAILSGASAQIRNSATNGGNLLQKTRCYYFYDMASPCNKRNPGSGCPAIEGKNRMHAILGHSKQCIAVFPSDMCIALAALEAKVEVFSTTGTRIINFDDFHRLPGDQPELDNTLKSDELITAIILPQRGFSTNYSYLKLRDRNSYAFALVSVATCLELENKKIKEINIALGGVSHKPWRNKQAEASLIGELPTKENFEKIASLLLKEAKGFEYNKFKIELAKRAIVRNCLMALDPSSQRPGAQPSL